MRITRFRTRKVPTSTRVCSPAGIPLLERQVTHWAQEVTNTRAQIAAGQYPEHMRRAATLRSIREEIKFWSAPSDSDRREHSGIRRALSDATTEAHRHR